MKVKKQTLAKRKLLARCDVTKLNDTNYSRNYEHQMRELCRNKCTDGHDSLDEK